MTVSRSGSSTDASGYAWRANLAPALIVFLISVPLSMGIAIASGVPPARGLVTAMIGGIVIGFLAGSPLQISGPSAGLAVMVYGVVEKHGLQALAPVVIVMGLIQVLAGKLRLGQMFRAVSPAVINGMLAGIGALIFSAQFHVMVDDEPKGSGLRNLLSIPGAVYKGLVPLDGSAHHLAAFVGVLTLAVLIGSSFLLRGPFRRIPAPLAAVGIASLVVILFGLPVQRVDMPSSLMAALAPPDAEAFALLASPAILLAAVALAFVASAETLLCATAVDAMHGGERTDYDRELFAQGVGNTLCGLVGALPTTGVITRSTANVQAQATSRASAILVGAFILIVMVVAPATLELIPRASLAGLLVYVGYKLVKGRPYRELRRYGKSELFVFAATFVVIVTVDLLTGIVVGLTLAALKVLFARGIHFHRFTVELREDERAGQLHLHLRGSASFVRLPKLASTLERLPRDREVHLHVEELDYIDHACLDLLDRWEMERLRLRASVRVQWNTLHHRYHAGNVLDATPETHAEAPTGEERLLDFLSPARVMIDPHFEDEWAAIEEMGKRLALLASVDGADLVSSVTSREHEASTCLGHGLMIPHGTLPDGRDMAGLLAISSTGWGFKTPDGKPVRCIVLLATPDDEASRHLAVLAAFARLFLNEPELREDLLACTAPNRVIELLRSERAQAVNYAFESREG